MNNRLDIWVPGKPATKGSWRHIGKGRMVAMDKNLKKWAGTVRQIALMQRRAEPPMSGPVEVWVNIFLERGKTVTRPFPTVPPDIDKLARAALDALTGVAYEDDGQVCRLQVVKLYANAKNDVGVRLIAQPFVPLPEQK